MDTNKFTTKKHWVRIDGWRGYEEPIYYVAGANDTGTFSDSPCPTHQAKSELAGVRSVLRKAKIKSKQIITRSTNAFCIHRYLIVTPADFERAKELVNEYYQTARHETRLLYVNG
jgi:predicted phosphodiesterase